jgi:glutathione S-transferase
VSLGSKEGTRCKRPPGGRGPPCLIRTARQDVNVGKCRIGGGSFVVGSYKARRVTHAEDNCRRHGFHGWRHAITRGLPMTPTITAFERSPDGGKGLARDMRVRWALEEVGQPYEVRLVSFGAMKEPAHRALHPFGQIPTYEEGDLVLFESGAIIFHIAERHAGLLPDDANARARAITWMFAALNTVEPPILDLQTTKFLECDKTWYEQRLPLVVDRIRNRLGELSRRLADADWLDGAFSAGDLMMAAVLLRLKPSGMLDGYPNLSAYVARGEARPAYKRAFDAQLAVFTGKPPTC